MPALHDPMANGIQFLTRIVLRGHFDKEMLVVMLFDGILMGAIVGCIAHVAIVKTHLAADHARVAMEARLDALVTRRGEYQITQ